MTSKRAGYINVDELMPQVSVEQVAAFYGATLADIKQVGDEIRTRCFLNCGRTEPTGERAIAIKASDPVKRWRCHQYGCGRGGNLVSLCDYLKPGEHAEGRPRGQRFKEIAADLQAMVAGVLSAESPPTSGAASTSNAASNELTTTVAEPKPPARNLPLARSDNERVRALVDLDRKLLVDPAAMNAQAAAYFRRRPFLSPEVCRKWRIGYLPSSGGSDRTGGTMRGKIVYPLQSERGEVLTWFGRDPQFETKHQQWLAAGRAGREPEKFHFVKGFQRGLELFGQQTSRLDERGYREQLTRLGLIVVEGPNDVIALDVLGVPAVGLCANTITAEQVRKLARWSHAVAGGNVTLLLDCDEEGTLGARRTLVELAPHCRVRLAWTPEQFNGRFRNRQPESLSAKEWELIAAELR